MKELNPFEQKLSEQRYGGLDPQWRGEILAAALRVGSGDAMLRDEEEAGEFSWVSWLFSGMSLRWGLAGVWVVIGMLWLLEPGGRDVKGLAYASGGQQHKQLVLLMKPERLFFKCDGAL